MTRDVTPFELEGMVSTVTVLRLTTPDLGALKRSLRAKLEQLPGFFQDAPVVVDLTALEGSDEDGDFGDRQEVSLDDLAALLRELKVVPIGVRNLRESRRADARAAGLAIIRGGKRTTKVREVGKEPARSERSERREPERAQDREPERALERESFPPGSMVLRTPLRSGQVVYAEQCDAIILAPINAGAEIIADGNIHVYASLRGRALAGAHGNEEARIFCKSLDADLVAIAGCYLRADEIPERHRGKPAQIYLENGNLVVADL